MPNNPSSQSSNELRHSNSIIQRRVCYFFSRVSPPFRMVSALDELSDFGPKLARVRAAVLIICGAVEAHRLSAPSPQDGRKRRPVEQDGIQSSTEVGGIRLRPARGRISLRGDCGKDAGQGGDDLFAASQDAQARVAITSSPPAVRRSAAFPQVQ